MVRLRASENNGADGDSQDPSGRCRQLQHQNKLQSVRDQPSGRLKPLGSNREKTAGTAPVFKNDAPAEQDLDRCRGRDWIEAGIVVGGKIIKHFTLVVFFGCCQRLVYELLSV